jgi:alpha-tubulin suppressor-like RCC1 family protein
MRTLRTVTVGLAAAALLATSIPPAVTVAASVPTITAIAAGSYHACAITSGGGLVCWGANYSGQLGDGTTIDRLTPVPVLGLASGVAAVAAGEGHTCAVTRGGAVKCWGSNEAGQLGDGTTTQSTVPVDVVGLASGVRSVTAGWGGHTCAITAAGGVTCWGNNGGGQLGDGTTTPSSVPVDVVGLSSGVSAIVTGGFQTCALTSGGGVKCWGYGGDGQLGNGSRSQSTVPVDVAGLSSGVTAIAAGDGYACALTASGGVMCWGANKGGLLWEDTKENSLTPVEVKGLDNRVVAINAGQSHICVLTKDGGVECWGANGWGQLGDGTTVDSPSPVDVSGLTSRVTGIAVNGFSNYGCAIAGSGGIRCWGSNKGGQLGDGTTTSSSVPVDVTFARRQATSPPATVSWAATIAGAGLSGRAALAVPPTGWATSAFSLYHLKTGVSVSARILAGAACGATAATILAMPGFVTTIGGTWTQQWTFDGSALVRVRSAITNGTPLWFEVTAGGRRTCVKLVPA